MTTAFVEMFSQVSQVTDTLFISSCYAVKAERLKQLGISFVVNCTLEVPNLRDPQIETVQVHVDDTPFTNLKMYFDRITDRIAETIVRGGKVLVHCVAGVSRSASMVLAYLMKHKRMTLREAYQLLKQRRPIVRPNVGFWRQLIQYETKLFSTSTVRMVDSAFGQIPDVYREEPRTLSWQVVPNAFPQVSHSNSMPSLSVGGNNSNNNNKDSKTISAASNDALLSSGSRAADVTVGVGVKESAASTAPTLATSASRYRSTNALNAARNSQLYAAPASFTSSRNYTPVTSNLSVVGRSQTAQNGFRSTGSRYSSSTFARLGFM